MPTDWPHQPLASTCTKLGHQYRKGSKRMEYARTQQGTVA